MFLIVGLGNPGTDYAGSRHNLGFMLVDKLAAETGSVVKRNECQSLVGNAVIADQRVKLAKPQTFMNLSGDAVACLVSKDRSDRSQLLVISDDLALPFGAIRLRQRGSAGGHNGLRSIIGALGTNEFIRLRIGIQPEHPLTDAKKFVLNEFSRAEKESLPPVLERAAEALRSVLRDGIGKAMSLHNEQKVTSKEPNEK